MDNIHQVITQQRSKWISSVKTSLMSTLYRIKGALILLLFLKRVALLFFLCVCALKRKAIFIAIFFFCPSCLWALFHKGRLKWKIIVVLCACLFLQDHFFPSFFFVGDFSFSMAFFSSLFSRSSFSFKRHFFPEEHFFRCPFFGLRFFSPWFYIAYSFLPRDKS